MKRVVIAISLLLILLPSGAKAQDGLPETDYSLDFFGPTDTYAPLRMPTLLQPVSIKPILPDFENFVSYNRFQRQIGLTVPNVSANRNLMLAGSGGYMGLYGRGGHRLGLSGSNQNYTSLGFSNTVSLGYSYAPAEWITFYGGVYASDGAFHMTPVKDFGFSGRARVKVAERLYVNAYGQYSIFSNSAQSLPVGMYPATSYGGTIEVKITDKFGIEGGAFREFDPVRREWSTRYYASPVFY